MKKKKSIKKMGEIDYGIFYSIILLLSIGVVMVYSASSYFAMYKEGNSAHFFIRQASFAVLGIVAMIFMMAFDYHKIKKFTIPLLVVTVGCLLAVFAFDGVNGAQRWIKLGPASFQPSELAKYAVVIFMAMSLERHGEKVKDFIKGPIKHLAIAGIFAALILKQPNMSIASVIMFVTFIMLFVAGMRWKHLIGMGLVGLAGGLALIFTSDYRADRALNFLNPWKDAAGEGYQLIQSFYALGSGGITGLGLGQSRQKTLYMPEPHNDFIFAIIGEELGLIGCLCIMALFTFFIWRGIKVAMNARDAYGMFLAIGITSIIAVQAIINIAVVTGSMPVTGVPLPFISYGGTSLVINLTGMGILLNISRQTQGKEVINTKQVKVQGNI